MTTKEVSLGPGESQELVFSFTPTEARTHKVTVNGLSGSLQVIALADLYGRVRDASSMQPLANVKATVDGEVTYSDTGGNFIFIDLSPGLHNLILQKDGYTTLPQTIDLASGYNELFFNLTPEYVAEGFFTVSPEWAELNWGGDKYTTRFTVTNTGGETKTETVKRFITEDSTTIYSWQEILTLDPGQDAHLFITVDHPGYPGDRVAIVQTEEMTGKMVIHFFGGVGGELGPTELDVPDTVGVGDDFHCWLPLKNIGDGILVYDVAFYLDDVETGRSSGQLQPGEGKTPGDIYIVYTPGTHLVEAKLTYDSQYETYRKDVFVS